MNIDAIYDLLADLEAEHARELEHIKAIAGPSGGRSGQPVQMAMSRNDIRARVIARLRAADAPEPELGELSGGITVVSGTTGRTIARVKRPR
jgi:hypothetical protein